MRFRRSGHQSESDPGASCRSHDAKTARLVLTVTVTADVVDWCLLVGDRIAPDALRYEFEGDPALAEDLVTSVPASATL